VVVLKTGRHPGAQRAAASHTAALSGDVAVIYAALRQAGVHLVEDGLTLLDVAASSIASRRCGARSGSSPIPAA
jgi:acyl-CoA synthetase (NDP forming)